MDNGKYNNWFIMHSQCKHVCSTCFCRSISARKSVSDSYLGSLQMWDKYAHVNDKIIERSLQNQIKTSTSTHTKVNYRQIASLKWYIFGNISNTLA